MGAGEVEGEDEENVEENFDEGGGQIMQAKINLSDSSKVR